MDRTIIKQMIESQLFGVNAEIVEPILTDQEIDYLITLCNFNENGEQYADPNREEIREKLRRMK